ncbi:hypothetical protein Goshw_027435 [Gossypium schwendimanii]|uniref:DUF4283 domain-containing protein n=1 Tax=Gossypium schwendimanii TaxID=34291 RepID=A0A7J9MWN1_GOSSC|nr:hypothetical protein [Gossypium schwendimanii]
MTGESLTFDGDIGRATKKIRKRLNEPLPPIPDNPLVDEKGMAVISNDSPTASWKDKLLGNLDIRFQDDNEYLTAILGGMWTIFGHYLMVRPWTPGFSMDQAQPSNLMVWIRLPGLSEGMYTTSLLKFIGGTGSLLCQIKIDGRTQQLEYESLPMKQRRGPRPVEAKSVGVTAAGETSCFRIFGGNLVDATRINAQESNVDDMSQTVTTQSEGVSGTTTRGHSRAAIFHPSITALSSFSLFHPITSQEYASDTH